ncbi:MAG: lysine--tRNA ligase, partial [Clostridia bacterium]|nr:lysine--tRNA ligase [Clostridia bacterium]
MNDERLNDTQSRPELDENEVRKVRIAKLTELTEKGENPFELTSYDRTATAGEVLNNYSEFEGKSVRIAGRMVSKRVMGKASFGHILDSDGKIQGYFSRDAMGVDEYQGFKKWDVGDIIGMD